MERTTVPFHLSSFELDTTIQVDTDGVVRIDGDVVVIEYRESRINMSNLKKEIGQVRVVRIPMNEVEAIEVRRWWLFAPRLRIRTRSLVALAEVPGASGNEATLPLRRRDHDRARELAVNTSLLLSSREIRRLEEQVDDSD